MTFESKEQLDSFIQRFEAGEHTAAEWTHPAHLAMAAVYCDRYGTDAFYRIRAGIHHLNWHHGTISTATRGYHETLTIFWTAIVAAHMAKGGELVDKVNSCIASHPTSLFRDYYSFDVVKSQQARREWVAPDLKPLPEKA
ncbi:hypothetical protein F183_A41600 [Bryobacterales bacterium F-183]|nr:hypothetical protein F183_A41600 [Bryobacterales bacterium F-183]